MRNGAFHGSTLPDSMFPLDGAAMPERHTATRRLCAGTYLDREYCQRLLREIYNSRRRRVAPSYGYDLIPVLQHAWRAWFLELARDVLALTLLVVAVLAAPLGTLLITGFLCAAYALRACWRALAESTQLLRKRKSYDYMRGLRFRAKVAVGGLVVSVLVIGGILLAMRANPQSPGDHLAQTGVLVALVMLTFAATGIIRQRQLDLLHHPEAVRNNPRSGRLRTLDSQQTHPATVYSGYRPFVGSGEPARLWSFAQRIVRHRGIGLDSDEEFPASQPPFTTGEIVEHLKKSIQDLASTAHSETSLPGLTVRDHVFIDGTYVVNIPGVLSSPLPDTVLRNIMANPREEARYHIACQVESWEGELVTTVFVHISLQGRTLYVEFSTYALYPTPPHFHVIDEIGGTGPRAALRMARRGLSELPDVLGAPRRIAAAPKDLVNAHRAQRDVSEKIRKRHDIGARVSAKEIAWKTTGKNQDQAAVTRRSRLDQDDTSYFQSLDVYRHSKIIERRLLAGIEEFLKSKEVDTSEFTERAVAILNYGMMNIGRNGVNIVGNNLNTGHRADSGGAGPAAPNPH